MANAEHEASMARSTNTTRDLLDKIRNAGGTGKHHDIYDHQQGFMVRVTPAGVISFCYRIPLADIPARPFRRRALPR